MWLRVLDFSSAGCGVPRKGIVADSCCRPRARSGHATTVDDLLVDSDLFVLFFYFFGSRIVSTPMSIYTGSGDRFGNLHLLLLLADSFGVLYYFSWFF